MLSLRLLGNIFDLEILFWERSGTFRDYGIWCTRSATFNKLSGDKYPEDHLSRYQQASGKTMEKIVAAARLSLRRMRMVMVT